MARRGLRTALTSGPLTRGAARSFRERFRTTSFVRSVAVAGSVSGCSLFKIRMKSRRTRTRARSCLVPGRHRPDPDRPRPRTTAVAPRRALPRTPHIGRRPLSASKLFSMRCAFVVGELAAKLGRKNCDACNRCISCSTCEIKARHGRDQGASGASARERRHCCSAEKELVHPRTRCRLNLGPHGSGS